VMALGRCTRAVWIFRGECAVQLGAARRVLPRRCVYVRERSGGEGFAPAGGILGDAIK